MKTILVRHDPNARMGIQKGCYTAKLKENQDVRAAGKTKEEAISNLLGLAPSHGESGERASYEVVDE